MVEVDCGGRVIDLHSWASFGRFEYVVPDVLIFRFDVDESEGGRHQGRPAREVLLQFAGIRQLRVWTADLEAVYESDSLSYFIYRHVDPDRGYVEVTMMDGLTFGFEAGSVRVTMDDSDIRSVSGPRKGEPDRHNEGRRAKGG